MSQINIRVNEQTDRIFQFLAKKRKIPKALLVKEMLLENLKGKVLSQLLKEYEKGEIRLKTIGTLLEMSPHDLFTEIARNKIECPITPEIDEYTQNETNQIISKLLIKKDVLEKK